MSIADDAQTLWAYHQLNHPDRSTDIAIGLGSHDIGVAEHTADLYHRGLVPLIVFTGANAPTTVEVFPRGEAVHYAERAEEMGVPESAILIEPTATNTSENFTATRNLLRARRISPKTATLVSRPYQQRRAYATARKVWPELQVTTSARSMSLHDYIETIGDRTKVINMLVGDTQRIWAYAEAGFAEPQPIDAATCAAYQRLVDAGFTRRLIADADPAPPRPE